MEMLEVIVSPDALRDLAEIHEFIAADKPRAADKMIARIFRRLHDRCDIPRDRKARKT